MRIDTLAVNNAQTQGARKRELLSRQSSEHLEHAISLMTQALRQRPYSASRSTVILGAGACTEIPLAVLAHQSDEVVLADLDLTAMQQARAELTTPALRKLIRFVTADLSGGVSANMGRLLAHQPWSTLLKEETQILFDTVATCIENCPVPDPPQIPGLGSGEAGIVISSLLLSQLFSYPLLDVLDRIQSVAPQKAMDQEQHRRYQDAARNFRVRIIEAHLHLLRALLDHGGLVVLLCDVRGFVFDAPNTQILTDHRRTIPLVPRAFFELVESHFTVLEKREWEWLTDMPAEGRYGRGYEVAGYLLC